MYVTSQLHDTHMRANTIYSCTLHFHNSRSPENAVWNPAHVVDKAVPHAIDQNDVAGAQERLHAAVARERGRELVVSEKPDGRLQVHRRQARILGPCLQPQNIADDIQVADRNEVLVQARRLKGKPQVVDRKGVVHPVQNHARIRHLATPEPRNQTQNVRRVHNFHVPGLMGSTY